MSKLTLFRGRRPGDAASAPLADRIRSLLAAPRRLLWAVRVRWLTIGGFLLLSLAAHAFGLFVSVVPVLAVAALGGVLNTVNGWCVRRGRHVLLISAVAMPLDHVFATYLVFHTGGERSPFLVVYAVQVLATAMLVDTVVAAGSAVLAILLWTATVTLQSAGLLRFPPLYPAGAALPWPVYQGAWAAFLLYCLALLVYLGGYIGERLHASESDLAEQHRRLKETLGSLSAAHAGLTAAHARLQQTEAQLIHAEKMRGLGVLVAGVAHELNNPISFVSANVEHLREAVARLRAMLDLYAALPLPAETRTTIASRRREMRLDAVLEDLPGMLDDCAEGARRTKEIVGGLRAFSRSDERESFQRCDVHRGIEIALGLVAHRLRDRVRVQRDFAALPAIACLPGPLNQVFMNLLVNAADAIGGGAGNIWISTRCDGAAEVSIVVRDDGAGMEADVCARVFEPFFTTKPVGSGTGLGLSVSYGIVQRHGGKLTVESVPGHGSTFTVRLPVTQPPDAD